jgi:hypothetical protein
MLIAKLLIYFGIEAMVGAFFAACPFSGGEKGVKVSCRDVKKTKRRSAEDVCRP